MNDKHTKAWKVRSPAFLCCEKTRGRTAGTDRVCWGCRWLYLPRADFECGRREFPHRWFQRKMVHVQLGWGGAVVAGCHGVLISCSLKLTSCCYTHCFINGFFPSLHTCRFPDSPLWFWRSRCWRHFSFCRYVVFCKCGFFMFCFFSFSIFSWLFRSLMQKVSHLCSLSKTHWDKM